MKTPSIQSTNNYSLFICHKNQQPMSPKHVRDLAESIRDNGFMPSKPVQVYKEGGKYVIIDGHHRVKAAEATKSFVYFVVVDKELSDLIGVENMLVRRWHILSFVKLYASRGNKEYETALRYEGKGIPIGSLLSFLSGEAGGSISNTRKAVVSGKFKVKSVRTVEMILKTFDRIALDCPNIKADSYVGALAAVLLVTDFEIETFWDRALANSRSIVKCASREQAMEVIEEVYNFRARIKINLAFLAKEALKKRNPIHK